MQHRNCRVVQCLLDRPTDRSLWPLQEESGATVAVESQCTQPSLATSRFICPHNIISFHFFPIRVTLRRAVALHWALQTQADVRDMRVEQVPEESLVRGRNRNGTGRAPEG